MNNSLAYELLRRKPVRVALIGLVIFIIICIIFVFLRRGDGLEVSKTVLKYDAAATQLQGSTLYGFNGSSFYSISTTSNASAKILYSGGRLPKANAIVWAGAKGALLNFSGSFVKTPVDDYSTAKGLDYDFDSNSTWYLDFSTRELSFVNASTIYGNRGVFNQKDSTVYYLLKGEDGDDSNSATLHAYSIVSHTDREIPNTAGLLEVSNVQSCPSSRAEPVCVISRDPSNESHYIVQAISREGKLTKILSQDGPILSTGNPSLFVTQSNNDTDKGGDDSDIQTFSRSTVRNIESNASYQFTRDMASGGYFIGTYGENNLIIVGNSDKKYSTTSPSVLGSTLHDFSLKESVSNLLPVGQQTNSSLLSSSTDGFAVILHKSGTTNSYLVSSPTNLKDVIAKCAGSQRTDYDTSSNTYTFYIPDTTAFSANVLKTQNCLADQTSSVVGANYTYAATDPVNGRITTD